MVQTDLYGKEVDDLERCELCNKLVPIADLNSGTIWQPFDDCPSFEYENVCERCMSGLLSTSQWCEHCERQVYEYNGMRKNIRIEPEFPDEYYDDKSDICICSDYIVCVKCCQDIWFEYGMKEFDDADFFQDSDLQDNGYERDEYFFCRTDKDYNRARQRFYDLQKEHQVIVSIEASGMGLEHHIRLWKKRLLPENSIFATYSEKKEFIAKFKKAVYKFGRFIQNLLVLQKDGFNVSDIKKLTESIEKKIEPYFIEFISCETAHNPNSQLLLAVLLRDLSEMINSGNYRQFHCPESLLHFELPKFHNKDDCLRKFDELNHTLDLFFRYFYDNTNLKDKASRTATMSLIFDDLQYTLVRYIRDNLHYTLVRLH